MQKIKLWDLPTRLFHWSLVAAVLAVMPLLIAAVAWSGITLPHQTAPMNAYLAAFMSAACLGGCLLLLKNTGERLALSWAGSLISARRTNSSKRVDSSVSRWPAGPTSRPST